MNVPLSAKPVLQIRGTMASQTNAIHNQHAALMRLARLGGAETVESFAKGSARGSVDGVDIGLPLADILDLTAEAARLKKDIGGVEAEIKKIASKLDNPNFLAKAPDEVVAENRRRLDDEQVKHLNMKRKVKHHRLGELDVVRQPINFSEYEQPEELLYAAPDLGQHNEDILKEFGFDDQYIKDLVEKNVL